MPFGDFSNKINRELDLIITVYVNRYICKCYKRFYVYFFEKDTVRVARKL